MLYYDLREFTRIPLALVGSGWPRPDVAVAQWHGALRRGPWSRNLLAPRDTMTTITKKELVDQIADSHSCKRVTVKRIIQSFLDAIIEELGKGNRLEFRDFGVFESKVRAARMAQNPKTLERVNVPSKRTVKFKVGRVMKQRLLDGSVESVTATRR